MKQMAWNIRRCPLKIMQRGMVDVMDNESGGMEWLTLQHKNNGIE